MRRILIALLLVLCAVPVAAQKPVEIIPSLFINGSGVARGFFTMPIPSATTASTNVAPYDTVLTGAYNIAGSTTMREFCVLGQSYRIRQNGSVSKVAFAYDPDAGLTNIHIKFWRYNGATYTLVGKTENLVASMGAAGLQTVTLATPVAVQEGDYYSILLVGLISGAGQLHSHAATATTTRYVTNVTEPAGDYDWAAGSALNTTAIPIQISMSVGPQILAIGDSITAGHPGHYSFVEPTATTDLDGQYPYWLGQVANATYQNMGIGSQTSTLLAARFAADVVALNPRLAVINIGVNDLVNGTTSATYVGNIRTMLNQCRAANITPVIVKMLPWTSGTTTGNTSGDGAVDGTTVVRAAFVDGANYYVNWWVTVGSETRQVTAYNGTDTLTVSPAFSAQVATGTATIVTAMTERDLRWEVVATLARAYPDAVLVDLDYTMGLTNANGPTGNLWDIKTAYNADGVHPNAAGYEAMGRAIAAAIGRKLQ